MASTEYEPLIQIENAASDKTIEEQRSRAQSKFVSPCRIRPILLMVSCVAITAIIILLLPSHQSRQGLSQSMPAEEWVRMEQHTGGNGNHAHSRILSLWQQETICDDEHTFIMSIALEQQNLDQMPELVLDVSDPDRSDTFHKYWTVEEVREYFAPDPEAVDAVMSWLEDNELTKDNGKVSLNSNGNVIKVALTCAEANNLLNTQFMFWRHKHNNRRHLRVRDGEYSLPKSLSRHVSFVTPSIRFPLDRHTLKMEAMNVNLDEVVEEKDDSGRSQRKADDDDINDDSSSSDYNKPKRLYELYRMHNQLTDVVKMMNTPSKARQAILSLIDEYYHDEDLDVFWKTLGIDPTSKMDRVPINQPQGHGSEATLDTEYMTSIGTGIETYVYYVDDDEDAFLGFIQLVMDGLRPLPTVVSISYGADEYELTEKYANHINEEFGKLALLGITIFASAGDSGVRGDDDDCLDGVKYIASFPASSTYVTAVGGTQGGTIQTDLDVSTGEIAWKYSGGGFSSIFKKQAWQTQQVSDYFANSGADKVSKHYNGNLYRGLPDIAAQSVDYVIELSNEWYLVAGTSAASPTVAGMVSLINYARMEDGKQPLGFLNPLLYKLQSKTGNDYYFNDVVEGYNMGCQNSKDGIGFKTAEGWDPVTGLGTPKFARLYDDLLQLPDGTSTNTP